MPPFRLLTASATACQAQRDSSVHCSVNAACRPLGVDRLVRTPHSLFHAVSNACFYRRSVVSFIAILLSYVWRFHDSMAQVNTASGNSSLHGMLLTLVHNATKPQATDLSSSPNGIVVLPWASRITLGVVFVVAAAHFVLNALFFTKLGLPVIGEDVPLDEVRVKADDFSSAATPDPSNVAIPGFFQAIPMHEAQIPAAIAGEGSLHTAEPYPSGHVPEVVPGGGRVVSDELDMSPFRS